MPLSEVLQVDFHAVYNGMWLVSRFYAESHQTGSIPLFCQSLLQFLWHVLFCTSCDLFCFVLSCDLFSCDLLVVTSVY